MTTLTTIFNRQNKTEAKKAAAKFGGVFKTAAMDRLVVEFETDIPFFIGQKCRKLGAVEANVSQKNKIPFGN